MGETHPGSARPGAGPPARPPPHRKTTLWLDQRLPGLALTGIATLGAGYVSDHLGTPLTLACLTIGVTLSFFSSDQRLAPGLGFAAAASVRIGVVLLAARVTLMEVADLGPMALAAVVAIVGITLLSGIVVSRALGSSREFGIVSGSAVAICGASAAMAFATLLGERRAGTLNLALILGGISAVSAAAMAFYPMLAHQLGLNDLQAGFLLGASIQDVAQSVGAGYAFSEHAGRIATIVKLCRVALLAPAMLIVGWLVRPEPRRTGAIPAFPWFVAGFFAVALANSTGIIPVGVSDAATRSGTVLLACAVTATGIRSRFQSFFSHGVKPLLAIVAASAVALVLSATVAVWLI